MELTGVPKGQRHSQRRKDGAEQNDHEGGHRYRISTAALERNFPAMEPRVFQFSKRGDIVKPVVKEDRLCHHLCLCTKYSVKSRIGGRPRYGGTPVGHVDAHVRRHAGRGAQLICHRPVRPRSGQGVRSGTGLYPCCHALLCDTARSVCVVGSVKPRCPTSPGADASTLAV